MSALEVEHTLARLYTDAQFRLRFLDDAQLALQGLDLTADEAAGLRNLDRAGLVMAAESYRRKRAARTGSGRGSMARFGRQMRQWLGF